MTQEALTPDQVIASVKDPMVLVKIGIQAAKEERYGDGLVLLAEAYERLTKRTDVKSIEVETEKGTAALKDVVPGNALSYYGLCLACHRGNYTEGAKFVHIAIYNEPMVGEHYLVLAKLWKHARTRRKMAEALEKGFESSPRYMPLRRMAAEVGLRKPPALPFLPRENTLNKALGKLRHRMEQSRLKRAEVAAAEEAARNRPPAARPRTSPGTRPAVPTRRPSKG